MNGRGMTLLEVLVALVIVGTAAVAMTGLQAAAARSERQAREREHSLADADRLLTAYTLLDRLDLDRRLGRREVGPFTVVIQRPETTLYRIAVQRSEVADMEDLVTVVFRPGANAVVGP